MSTRLVQPVTGGSFADQHVKVTNPVLRSGANALVHSLIAALTVKAPPAPALDATFAVTDADAHAATNNITVDGNGTLIDGAATLVLSANSVVQPFIFDRGQWRALAQTRAIEEEPGRLVTLNAPAGGGGGGTPGGANTDIQFNDGGAFGGTADLTFNKASGAFTAGSGNTTTGGTAPIAIGVNCTAGDRSVAIGDGATAVGPDDVALGSFSTAASAGAGSSSTALSNGTSTGGFSLAAGDTGFATRAAQVAIGSGFNSGSAATSGQTTPVYQLFGISAAGAARILKDNGSAEFVLSNDKAYRARIAVVAHVAGDTLAAMFIHNVLVHTSGGAAVIDLNLPEIADATGANGTGWAFAITAVGLTLRLTFTGDAGHTVYALANVEFSEL